MLLAVKVIILYNIYLKQKMTKLWACQISQNKKHPVGAFKAEKGALSGTCHKPSDRARVDVVTEAYSRTAFANPLNPDAFPGIRKMEAEVVRMTCNLFNGDPKSSCGTVRRGECKWRHEYYMPLMCFNIIDFIFELSKIKVDPV